MGNRVRHCLLLLVMGVMFSGCATSALWKNAAFDGFNEPARPANLHVDKVNGDWLVQYDEVNDNSDRIRRRAFYLNANRDKVRDFQMPQFVSPRFAPRRTPAQATISTNGQEFALYDGATYLGTYELPVYPAPSGRVKQVLLTPCTLVADATLVGGFIAVYYWLPMGAPGLAE